MTRAEAAPSSVAELNKDRHSHSLPGPASGPNKAGASAPDGASALATELGAERDARRELAAARASGESVPPPPPSSSGGETAHSLGFGQLNGAEQGVATPGAEQRDAMQTQRNREMGKAQPDLRSIAQSSAASAAHHPTLAEGVGSSGARAPDEVLGTVQTSTGTETGTGAAGARGGAGVEVGRDAATSNVV